MHISLMPTRILRPACRALSAVALLLAMVAAADARGQYLDVSAVGGTHGSRDYSFSPIFTHALPVLSGTMVAGAPRAWDTNTGHLGFRAVRWSPTGGFVELGVQGSSITYAETGALDVNVAGVAVGYGTTSGGGSRALKWGADGAAVELPGLSNQSSGALYHRAFGINDGGVIVGAAEAFSGATSLGTRPVRWEANGTITQLDNLGVSGSTGYGTAAASRINAAGTAVGTSAKYGGSTMQGFRVVRWNAGQTQAIELGHLGLSSDNATDGRVWDLNEAGAAVGAMDKYVAGADKGLRAVRWDANETAAAELDHLGTDGAGVTESQAYAINAGGAAVGYAMKHGFSSTLYGLSRAVRWDAAGTGVTELPLLSFYNESYASDIDDAGLIVGTCYLSGGSSRAVYWDTSGSVHDFNDFLPSDSGWVLNTVRSISESGWIIGLGTYDPDGPGGQIATSDVLYAAHIPEPSAAAAAALFAALPALRRRRRRSL